MTKNNSWQTIRFDQICKNISDRIDDPKTSNSNYYVGLEHLDSEEPKILRHGIPQDVSKTKLRFKIGHILFGKRRWYLRKVAVAGFEGICSAHMLVLEPKNEKIIKEFLLILMFGDSFYEKALTISAGSMSPTIKWKDIAKLDFLIPPISEQKKIIKIISVIDESITKTQNLLDELKTYKESKANDLLTKGIGHTRFKKVKSFFDTYDKIPGEWNVLKLKDICTEKPEYGANVSAVEKNELLPRYIRITDLNDDGSLRTKEWKSINEEKAKSYLLQEGDFLFARTGATVGKTYVYRKKDNRCAYAGYLIRFKPNNKSLNPDFLFYFTHSTKYWKWLVATQTWGVQPNVNAEQYSNMPIPLPPLLEQQKIASILIQLDEQYRQLENHLALLKKMRKSMINEKLTPPILRKKIVQ